MARHLITSALPYINGIKHLGNMVGPCSRQTSTPGTCGSGGTTEPLIPTTAKAMRQVFHLTDDTARWVSADQARSLNLLPGGTAFTVPPVLFTKITEENLETWRSRFGGSETE